MIIVVLWIDERGITSNIVGAGVDRARAAPIGLISPCAAGPQRQLKRGCRIGRGIKARRLARHNRIRQADRCIGHVDAAAITARVVSHGRMQQAMIAAVNVEAAPIGRNAIVGDHVVRQQHL